MCTEMHVGPYTKGLIKFSDFSENWSGSKNSLKNSPISNFMKIRSAVSELLHACYLTDGIILAFVFHEDGEASNCEDSLALLAIRGAFKL